MQKSRFDKIRTAFAWLDADRVLDDERIKESGPPQVEWDRFIPFIFLHAGCALTFFTGISSTAVIVCLLLYLLRMFAITAFYHRYFSHKSFKTSRPVQFAFALLGSMAVQRGPLWWAAHHRQHHAASDKEFDVHSPTERGFIWAHMGWITSTKNMATDYNRVRDFAGFPELRFINRFDWMMPTLLFIGLYAGGEWLRLAAPELKTNGPQLIAWGFFISTVLLFHATSAINSLAHLFGYRRFETSDNSRNNPLLAIVTLGEGWHNNHHKFSHCVRQGLTWWEIDITYYLLVLMEALGLISDLKAPPNHDRAQIESAKENADSRETRAKVIGR